MSGGEMAVVAGWFGTPRDDEPEPGTRNEFSIKIHDAMNKAQLFPSGAARPAPRFQGKPARYARPNERALVIAAATCYAQVVLLVADLFYTR